MANFSSAQLDVLEDALEDLEHDGDLERWLGDDGDDVVRERLVDYRAVLVAAREAMPIEDVPAGVLDDVLAQARTAAATPAAAAARPSIWARMRRSFLLPAVALAGTAALVLWIGQPDEVHVGAAGPAPAQEEASADAAPKAEAAPAGLAKERAAPSREEGAEAEAEEAAAKSESARLDAAPPAAAAPAKPADVTPSPTPSLDPLVPPEADDAEDEDASDEIQTYGEAPGSGVTKGNQGPASGRWDLITAADEARLAGDCVSARDDYSIALEDDLAAVRARAMAGLGLCDAQDGNNAAADANYERARELDAGVQGYIDSQVQTSKPRPKSKRRKSRPTPSKKSKPSSQKKAIEIDQASDPFG